MAHVWSNGMKLLDNRSIALTSTFGMASNREVSIVFIWHLFPHLRSTMVDLFVAGISD